MTATTPTTDEVTVVDENETREIAGLELDVDTATPADVISHLQDERLIMANAPDGQPLTYSLALDQRTLTPDEPLSGQGVQPTSRVRLLAHNVKG